MTVMIYEHTLYILDNYIGCFKEFGFISTKIILLCNTQTDDLPLICVLLIYVGTFRTDHCVVCKENLFEKGRSTAVQLHQEKIIGQIVDKRTLYASQPSDLVLRRQIIKLLFKNIQIF